MAANVTNTVALCPGHFGASWAQRQSLPPQRAQLRWLLPAALLGGLLGSLLLVSTSEQRFRDVVPLLILAACGLLVAQEPLRAWLAGRTSSSALSDRHGRFAAFVGVGGAAVYGGYFGAGLGIMLLAILGVVLPGELRQLNVLKQVLALVINVIAAVFFALAGDVNWAFAAVMAPTSLIGGHVGGKLAQRLNPVALRGAIVVFGVIIAVRMLVTR